MRRYAATWVGIAAPIVLFALAVVLVPRQISWVMAVGVLLTSLAFGWVRSQQFYLPGASTSALVAFWWVLAGAWAGWEAANSMVLSHPLLFLSPFIGLLGGYLSSRAEDAS